MICETKLTIYGYFFVGRNSLQQPKRRLWDSITPAYAGKSRRGILHRAVQTYYPRLRGEKLFIPVSIRPSIGSPPLARGKGDNPSRHECNLWDHPRLRGEKQRLPFRCRCQTGSPPLARGKGFYKLPARAG